MNLFGRQSYIVDKFHAQMFCLHVCSTCGILFIFFFFIEKKKYIYAAFVQTNETLLANLKHLRANYTAGVSYAKTLRYTTSNCATIS